MGKMDEREKKLCRLRDWGIWIVAVLLVANFILWNAHDNTVRNKVEPKIEENTLQIQRNTERLDSIAKAADSVFNAVSKHHLEDEHGKK